MREFTPEFVAKASLLVAQALKAGNELCDHCLLCGKCEHAGDDDLRVKMCVEAKVLNAKWEIAKGLALPYVRAIRGENEP
jgi:hypothetical protein